ncbi:type IV toxin-antitoxin system AbiEi family antitoxin domain-containing protein [Phytoactinopolyspora mesophila]|uniref:AbiEi antitoxin N-terminal domain-containing protein n=1 Tax=Phytoactinopolyspora mesophila TaxID=2650750 RepID=A0A7K3M011_9ACTN|nr:type IV toxin-antitoxin system AbiEi family antitoxin domain-containing protein [Phytoactinopolyspora mesophila]NDL56635.1 hypothetical protein [Phytoactinopolyspora mesophila]
MPCRTVVLTVDHDGMAHRLTRIPGDVERLLHAGHGVLTVGEAERAGVTRPRIQRLVRAELLIRLAKGVYADRARYEALDLWPAFALRSRAFTLACGPYAVAAGWSAVAIHDLPTIGAPPERPLVVVPVGSGSAKSSLCGDVRAISIPAEHRTAVDGCPVLSMARTAVDIGRGAPRDEALVVADAVMAGGTTVNELRAVLMAERSWPGSRDALWVIEHADPFAESALETLGRLTFIEGDLPVPISNAWVDLEAARYRPDHLLDDLWLIFEGDGGLKYNGRLDAAVVIERQREREWQLRQHGFEISRYGWRMARHHRPELADRFRSVIATTPRRAHPYRWYREIQTYRQVS